MSGNGLRVLGFAWLALFAVLVLGAAAVSWLGDPHASQSVVTMDLAPAKPRPVVAAPHAQAAPSTQTAAAEPPAPATPPLAATPQTVTQQIYAGKALVVDPSLIENTPAGPLPRIADDGTTPMRAYAPATASDGHPRIALVVGGLGISAAATDAAIKDLPGGVTLAFVPYDNDVQHWVGEARARGHEVLLEVPMEPYDFPDSDPGPHTLRSGVAEDANTERLVWALTRFAGYAGVTNLQGGRFLSDAASLAPMMTYLARRGLLFYDNGQATHSAAPDVASQVGAAFAQADSIVDKIQTTMEIDRRLSSLESVARTRGTASGSAFLYPVTIERVKSWASGLQGRGFVLVPASAIVSAPK